ncbi:2-dehydro-3-deoxygalactonokinase [Enterobacteriaceae bacterium H18W14]|uniref:2-dehydro-3-deoxygalactonokinase n=1 Tax=Dryocola boscaweniae TaxID=2925397 RepID=UPI0022F0B8B8|nr:2-dehydro-3-deoxygalactonokinase [Dryocola boscaweniae]MCT4713974.1 2-dehydro-3-deoxygalactonokinase [Dryocola boscaweniae]
MTSGYIAIDWGSTNLRAWHYRDGVCVDSRQTAAGVTRLNGKSPQAVFDEVTHGWREQDTPVLMAGMVGSNAGWKIAPYLPCPAPFASLSQQLTPVLDKVWIIPGLSVQHDDNCNVMRGEETQLLGAKTLSPAPLYIMPGTHCKWVHADERTVQDFRTVMTGELHHLLLNHSLIGAGLPEQKESFSAFNAGLERGINDRDLLPRLFEVRAAHVLGGLPREEVSEFLSGLLIGNEAAAMTRHYALDDQQPVTLVANPSLSRRYVTALSLLGFRTKVLDGDEAFQAGIRSIANAVAN